MKLVTPPEGFRTRGPRPTGARIVLIRHGEAHCNLHGIVGGPKGCGGLTDLGVAQAHALRERLTTSREFDDAVAIFTSTLPRAVETGSIIAPGLPNVSITAREDLSELNPGVADGLTWPELMERYGVPDWDEDPSAPMAPEGESWLAFNERCVRVLTELASTFERSRIVVVCHGGVIEQALKLAYGRDAAARLRLRTENCSISELEFRDEQWHLLRYNDRAPLAASEAAKHTSYVELSDH